MNYTTRLPEVGTQALIRLENLAVTCTVLNAKFSYGRPRILVTPVAGNGQMWVELSRLSGVPGENPKREISK